MAERTCATCRWFGKTIAFDGVVIRSTTDEGQCFRPIKRWWHPKPQPLEVTTFKWWSCTAHQPPEVGDG